MGRKEEEVTICEFTDDEMYILSDALLSLICGTNEALRFTYDKKCIEELQKVARKYQMLNEKICKYLK